MDNNNQKLSIEESKKRWIDALHRKLEMRTLEEWDYETMSETIYKDDVLEFYRECQGIYGLENVKTRGGVESELDYFLDETIDLGEILSINCLKGMSFMDYMEAKGFPISFKTWPDDTEMEHWNPAKPWIKTKKRNGKRK